MHSDNNDDDVKQLIQSLLSLHPNTSYNELLGLFTQMDNNSEEIIIVQLQRLQDVRVRDQLKQLFETHWKSFIERINEDEYSKSQSTVVSLVNEFMRNAAVSSPQNIVHREDKSLVDINKELQEKKRREKERKREKKERKREKREKRERKERRSKRSRSPSDSSSKHHRKKKKKSKHHDSSSSDSEEERSRKLAQKGYLTFDRDKIMTARPIDHSYLQNIVKGTGVVGSISERFGSSSNQK
jgi:Mg-chelatase subunit ChlI